MDNIIKYGDGKEVRYGIHTIFVLDYGKLDDIIETEFPFLNWQGIIAEEEMNNDSTMELVGIGLPKYTTSRKDVAELLAGRKPACCIIYDILCALHMRDILPSGDYLIRVSW